LGLPSTKNIFEPHLVTLPTTSKALDIVVGSNHHYVMTSNGEIYCWGLNIYGQLGLGNDKYIIDQPTHYTHFGKQKIKLQARDNYSCTIIGGELYIWGYNLDGRLGLGTKYNVVSPTKVNFPQNRKVIQIALGNTHCLALTVI